MMDKEEDKEQKKEKPRKKIIVEEVVEKPAETTKTDETKIEEKPKEEETKEATKEPEVIEEAPKKEEKPPEETKKEELSPQPMPKFNLLWIIIPLVLILIAIVGGVFVYEQGVLSQKAQLAPPSPEATIEANVPTPTPTPSVDLSKYTIDIQNGSGIAGQGAKMQSFLTQAGFKVGTVGNAQTYDYTKTVIQAKSNTDPDFLSQLRSTLSKNYVLDTNQTLAASSSSDIIIIVGSSKPQ